MLDRLAKLIDVKSIVTISLISTLVFVVVSGRDLNNDTFLLFSNVVTMVVTYFFTKKEKVTE